MGAKEYLERWSPTEKEKELIPALKSICDEDDYDFVLGVLVHLEREEERETVLDYIRKKKLDIMSDVTMIAFYIDQHREKKEQG